MNAPHTTPVHLLWTGGWDSTFRLLELLLLHRLPVLPHYLSDPSRPSTQTELATMARIGEYLRATHPRTSTLLQPTRVVSVDDVPPDPESIEALRRIRTRLFIGDQYAWLPAYCRHARIDDMELGVHVDDKVQALLRDFVTGFEHPAGYHSVRVDPKHAGSPEHTLFRWFGFPLFRIDKRGIERQATAEGWAPIMDMTWFCHTPVHGRPCGTCAPCVFTIQEGLARRVPPSRRALSFFYRRLAWPLKDPLRQVRASLRGQGGDRRY